MKFETLDWFSGSHRPHLGQFLLWGLLLGGALQLYNAYPSATGERNIPVTIFWFLPDFLRTNESFFFLCRNVYLVAGCCWAFQVLTPWTSWVTVGAFTAVVSLFYENSTYISHIFHQTNLVLLIHAMWYHYHQREIQNSIASGTFWNSKLYPNWALELSVFSLALYHFYAAISKLWFSGLDWVNGVSFQVWLHLWGREGSILADAVLANAKVAMVFQLLALVVEFLCIFAIFSKRIRLLAGICLLGLYFSIFESFGYFFQLNCFLVTLIFLPFQEWFEKLYIHFQNRGAYWKIKLPKVFSKGLALFLQKRFDPFGCIEMVNQDRKSE